MNLLFNISVFVGILLVSTNSQTFCNRSPQGQDSKNGAYITSQTPSTATIGYQCKMKLCPGQYDSQNQRFIGQDVTNSTYISAIDTQMCSNQASLLGCSGTLDVYVLSSDVSSNWYNVGCKFCSCPMAAEVKTNQTRRTDGAIYVETLNAGRTCQILECSQSGCHQTNDSAGYAYFPKQSPTFTIQFPDPADTWRRVSRSSWTEFDVPTSYSCPRQMGVPHANLCDVFDLRTRSYLTLWKDTRYFQWNSGTKDCDIHTCTGNGALTKTYSTSDIGKANLAVEFRDYIRRRCASQLQGCYNTLTRWRYNRSAAVIDDCTTNTVFCKNVYCDCPTANSTTYSVRKIFRPFTGVGTKLPVGEYRCQESQCSLARRITSSSPIETSLFIPIPDAECPNKNKYYPSTRTGTLVRGTQDRMVPVAFRQSLSRTALYYGVTSQYFCSSLGYQIPITQKKCYRSPLYSVMTFQNITISFCTSKTNCSSGITSRTGWPLRSTCQQVDKNDRATYYQYAQILSRNNIDNNWVEYQCFANASNFRMESICESSTRRNLLWDAQVTSGQVAGETQRCLSTPEAQRTMTDFHCGEAELLKDNKCENPQISNYIRLQAECACKHIQSQTAGGDGRYANQAKRLFYDKFQTTTNLNYLNKWRSYGCTYRFSCSGGSVAMTTIKPQVSGRFIVQVPCDQVDWATLKSNLETVLSRYNRVTQGNQQGVMLDSNAATPITLQSGKIGCRAPFKTLMQVPEMADWFVGNLTTAGASSPAFASGSYEGLQVNRLSFSSAATPSMPSTVNTLICVAAVMALVVW